MSNTNSVLIEFQTPFLLIRSKTSSPWALLALLFFSRVKLKALKNDQPNPVFQKYDQIIFELLLQVLYALRRTKSERRFFYISLVHGLNDFLVKANKLAESWKMLQHRNYLLVRRVLVSNLLS